jgi:hypothetical protein
MIRKLPNAPVGAHLSNPLKRLCAKKASPQLGSFQHSMEGIQTSSGDSYGPSAI